MALGATAAVTVGFVSAFASSIGAQTTSDPIRSEMVSIDSTDAPQDLPVDVVPAISDTGAVVVYDATAPDVVVDPSGTVDPDEMSDPVETIDPTGGVLDEDRRVWIRDRIGSVSRSVAEARSVAPGVSGNGCIVAYTVLAAVDATPAAVDATNTAVDATLTAVDRCAADVGFPLPIGNILDTVALDTAQVAPPSLSFDGSTVVWSTGREIRRYVRPVDGGPYVRSHTFDVISGGSPDVVTGLQTDVSADGRTVVFVAGPGTSPFEPEPSNVYAWTSATPELEPRLISATPEQDSGPRDSSSPTISADGSFVVFESTSPELDPEGSPSVIASSVIGFDVVAQTGRVLVDDASRPAVSADGTLVVYQRGDAVRVLSTSSASTTDHGIDELVNARPASPVAISQHGRWLVFAAMADPVNAPLDVPVSSTESASETRAVWALDRSSSNAEVVDTTTTTTAPTPTTVPSTAGTATPSVIVPRDPTLVFPRPTVRIPRAPRSSAGSEADSASSNMTVSASLLRFGPTSIGGAPSVESVLLTNEGSRVLIVESASVDDSGEFSLVADDCSGSRVDPGSSCTVEVEFAPITVGTVNAELTFRSRDGATASTTLEGEGVAEPTIDLVPEVAGAGQTVTVFGAGFPPLSTVELSRPGSATPETIDVDADGTFAHVVVVLPNTPAGTALLTVSGQNDAFGDVTTELVVSGRGPTSANAALRGGLTARLGR